MAVVLQISDLHRSVEDPIGNDELLAALKSDQARWPASAADGPDLVVFSGDLVQGVGLGSQDVEGTLDRQWADARAFVDEIAEAFVAGDRSRVVLVPGNHDVDWNRARAAMAPVDESELETVASRLPEIALRPESSYRWNWHERALYRVVDVGRYRERCDRFLGFRRDFYEGLVPDPLRYGPDIVFLEYPDLKLAVTGLSSWHGNDCYCRVGAIDPSMLAAAQRAASASALPLQLAVWHHSTAGAPAQTDFLDTRELHRLIDYGFRVGLYGHQHRTEVRGMSLKLPTAEEMALVSAGSLAAGRRELPPGVHRQYSLIELRPEECKLTVHVREAVSDLVFAPAIRTDLGGSDCVDLSWSPRPVTPGTSKRTTAADDAYTAFARRDLDAAWEALSTLSNAEGPVRGLGIDVLMQLEKWEDLARWVGAPESQDELVALVDALCRAGAPQDAEAALTTFEQPLALGPDARAQLKARIDLAGLSL